MVQKITIITEVIDKAGKPLKQIRKSIDEVQGKITETTQNFKKGRKGMAQYGDTIIKTTRGLNRFKMHLLSVMFFGMLVQRTFQRIMRSAVMSFTKIMEASEMLGTAVQILGVHFEYLKFIIGSAINNMLEPLMPIIMRLINAFTEFTQKHPKLVAWVILLGFALGTLLFLFGTLGLGIQGMITAFPFLTAAFALLVSPIGLIVLALVFLVLLIPAARKLFLDMFKNIGAAALNFGKLIMAVFRGDWHLAILYATRALINLLDATSNFAGMIVQIFIEVGKWMFLSMISPLLLILKLIDSVTGSNFAGAVVREINQAKSALNAGVGNLFGGSSEGLLAENQAKIDALLASRNTVSQNTTNVTNNQTIENVEISGVNAKELFDELKRYT